MTSTHARANARARQPPPAANAPLFKKLYPLLLLLAIFAALFLLHLPLLRLPYYWDEAGYFVPAAHDLLHTGDPVPHSTLSNAHPPLVMAYLALVWKIFGERIEVTRAAMLFVSSVTLLGLFYLARRVANRTVSLVTLLCTALYPVFFAQSSLAHLDMGVAALTIWGLLLYLPPRIEETTRERVQGDVSARDEAISDETTRDETIDAARDAAPAVRDAASSLRRSLFARRVAATLLFALAGLAKETAILTPVALAGWEWLCLLARRARSARLERLCSRLCPTPTPTLLRSLLLLAACAPILLWLAYHRQRTGYFFGNPEYFRYNVAATVNPSRMLIAGLGRLWHVTGYMNLFLLTGATVLAMFRPALSVERRRIDVPTQVVFAVLILAHVVALSVVGGAVLARYMLPVLPLLILICVSTLWRRVRRWPLVVALVCAGFVVALFVNPPYRYPWEENLAYRDFILLHEQAGHFLSANYAGARVLTAWPATDELKNPYFGYTDKAFAVEQIDHFSDAELRAAVSARRPFDVTFIFSTNYGEDLQPDAAARLLGGRIVYHQQRRGHWVAIIQATPPPP